MNNLVRLMATATASIALSGCAVMDSINWAQGGPGRAPGSSRVITVDAKQRHLIMTKDAKDQVRACAEPAPETFAAYSSSFLGILGLAPEKRDAQGSLAMGETVASLERTQTVNLLREMLYRTCERWLSGALDQAQFVTLGARDHRSMVAVLAIESLTGVVKPPSTIISGPAVSAAISQSKELLPLLAGYKEERIAAVDTEKRASDDYDKINEDYPTSGAPDKLCAVAPPPTDATWAPKVAKCKPAADKRKAAKDAADIAKANEKSILDQLKDLSAGMGSAVQQGRQSDSDDAGDSDRIPSRPDGEDLKVLTEAVRTIALTPTIDETLMFCVSYLHRPSFETQTDTRDICNLVITKNAERDLKAKDTLYKLVPTASEIQASAKRVKKYDEFKSDVEDLIARTPADRWSEFWAPFSGLLKNTDGLDCTTAATCAVVWSSARPYYRDYGDSREALEQAAEAWSLKLSEIGR